MTSLNIIEFLLTDERFEDTALVTDHKITVGVKEGNHGPDLFKDLSKMETDYTLCDTSISVTRPLEKDHEEEDFEFADPEPVTNV